MQREEPDLFDRGCQLEALLLARRQLGRDLVDVTRFGRPLGQGFAARQGVLFENDDAGGGMDLDGCESGYCMT